MFFVVTWTWLSRFAPLWTDPHEDYAGCHVPLVNSPGATSLHLKLQRFLKPPAPLSPDITLILMWKCQACGLVTVGLNPLKLCSTWLSVTSLPPLSSSSVLFCCCEWDCCAVLFLSVCTGTKQRERERVWEIFKEPHHRKWCPIETRYWLLCDVSVRCTKRSLPYHSFLLLFIQAWQSSSVLDSTLIFKGLWGIWWK